MKVERNKGWIYITCEESRDWELYAFGILIFTAPIKRGAESSIVASH